MSENKTPPPLLRAEKIGKCFGPVRVLEDVDFDVIGGEVHLLAGENGAGKSTLVRILGGIYRDYEGSLYRHGHPIRFTGPLDAAGHGIALIHQELAQAPNMSVAENLFLGRLPVSRCGFVDRRRLREKARTAVARFELDVDVERPVEDYSISVRQLLEIARALEQDAEILVMDEPTSALDAAESERLFRQIEHLRTEGRGIVYITHKMEEIDRIADRITVLRDGRLIGSAPREELPTRKLIRWMVGRETSEPWHRAAHSGQSEVLLRLERFGVRRRGRSVVRDVSLEVRKGEIVGLAGLQGSGNSVLLEALFGVYGGHAVEGHVYLEGKPFQVRSPRHAIRHGLALLTNDRKATGLVHAMRTWENIVMVPLPDRNFFGWSRIRRNRLEATDTAETVRLPASFLEREVGRLSGGNQQKAVLGKWFSTAPRVLLLDEPTRGVDVGAKQEIYRLIDRWTEQGGGVLLITSEMPELLALSDRIAVLHRGSLSGLFERNAATPDGILEAAMGGGRSEEVKELETQ